MIVFKLAIISTVFSLITSCKSDYDKNNIKNEKSSNFSHDYDTNKFHVIKNIQEYFTISGSERNFRFGGKIFEDANLSDYVFLNYRKVKLKNGIQYTNIYYLLDSIKINSIYSIYLLSNDFDGAHNENSIYVIKANNKKVKYYLLENYNSYCWQPMESLLIVDFKKVSLFLNYEYTNLELENSLELVINSIIKFIFKCEIKNNIKISTINQKLIETTNNLYDSGPRKNFKFTNKENDIIITTELYYLVCGQQLLYLKVIKNRQKLLKENLFTINAFIVNKEFD